MNNSVLDHVLKYMHEYYLRVRLISTDEFLIRTPNQDKKEPKSILLFINKAALFVAFLPIPVVSSIISCLVIFLKSSAATGLNSDMIPTLGS